MELNYPNKKTQTEIVESTKAAEFTTLPKADIPNKLIFGNNLAVMKNLLQTHANKIDLVYIDPPYSTNSVFKIGSDRANSISSSHDDSIAYEDTLIGPEFFEFLRQRLIFIRDLLSPAGSIYLHIDYKVGHYVKVLMDEIFGAKMFRNDIARIKCNPKNFSRRAYGNVKDLILFYSKTDEFIWNDIKVPFSEKEQNKLFKKTDVGMRKYTTIPLHAPGETKDGETGSQWRGVSPPRGRHWRTSPKILEAWDAEGLIEWSKNGVPRKKIFLADRQGKKLQDIWEFKDPQHPKYPTEKNLEMLKMIVQMSSKPTSTVLDCFCGSGTTLVAAEVCGRNWIGIDQSSHAIRVVQQRMKEFEGTLFSTAQFELLETSI